MRYNHPSITSISHCLVLPFFSEHSHSSESQQNDLNKCKRIKACTALGLRLRTLSGRATLSESTTQITFLASVYSPIISAYKQKSTSLLNQLGIFLLIRSITTPMAHPVEFLLFAAFRWLVFLHQKQFHRHPPALEQAER